MRELASAILYLLMRKNYEDSIKVGESHLRGNFTRVKVQATIAVSEVPTHVPLPPGTSCWLQIVSATEIRDKYFRRALGTVVWSVWSDAINVACTFIHHA